MCSGTRGTPAGPRLCPSLPKRAQAPASSIQACRMQPTEGLNTSKCSFSEGWAFLKCQKSWKRQLASLPAAWAKQPGLNTAERCLCSPHQARGQGAPRAVPMQAPLHPTRLLQDWWASRPHCKAKPKLTFPPCSPATVKKKRNLGAISSCYQHMPVKQPLL